jgi:hypothetical protein
VGFQPATPASVPAFFDPLECHNVVNWLYLK